MNQIHKIFKISLEVLTPVHIGSGGEITPNEYCLKDGKFYRFNFLSLIRGLDFDCQKKVSSELQRLKGKSLELRKYIKKLVDENFAKLKPLYQIDFSESFKICYGGNLQVDDFKSANSLAIKEFMGYLGQKYISGSSIKGAIRTALINEVFKEDYNFLEEKKNISKDFFSALAIIDAPIKSQDLKIARVDRVSKNNFYEVLSENTRIEFKMKFLNYKNKKFDAMGATQLSQKINSFYKKSLDYLLNGLENDFNKRLKLFNSRNNEKKYEKNLKMIEKFKEIKEILENCQANEFLLNLGFGGGKLFKIVEESISKRSDTRNFKPLRQNKLGIASLSVPFTYNLTEDDLMGWAKCKIITE